MKPARKISTTQKAAGKNVAVTIKPSGKRSASSKPAHKRPAVPPPAPRLEQDAMHFEIATRAYFIYVREGYPSGREMQHWLEAEAQLRGQ